MRLCRLPSIWTTFKLFLMFTKVAHIAVTAGGQRQTYGDGLWSRYDTLREEYQPPPPPSPVFPEPSAPSLHLSPSVFVAFSPPAAEDPPSLSVSGSSTPFSIYPRNLPTDFPRLRRRQHHSVSPRLCLKPFRHPPRRAQAVHLQHPSIKTWVLQLRLWSFQPWS